MSKDMNYKHKNQCVNLIDVMKKKGITKYHLCRQIGMPSASLYSLLSGRIKINNEKCAILADAVGEPLQDLFPHLKVLAPELADVKSNPDYDPREQRDSVVTEASKLTVKKETAMKKIEATQMVTEGATLAPKDGVHVKSRQVKVGKDMFDSYVIQKDEQVVIMTGIKAQGIDMDKATIKTDRKLLLEGEVWLHPYFVVVNSELAVVAYNHSAPFQIYRGMVIGQILFA